MGIVLLVLQRWLEFSGWITGGIFLVWLAKDFVFYPFVRTAYETDVKTGIEQLIGAKGIARQELDPYGYVHVRGELWRAEVERGAPPIARGTLVRIRAAQGSTLIVSPDEATQQ